MMEPEKSPLLRPQEHATIGVPVAMKQPREFKGRWFHVLGDCGPADVSATCLAWNAPWVAYGWNTQRGLGLTWWKEALKLLVLTCGVFALIRLLLVVLVETQCPDLPRPMDMDRPHGHHHGWDMMHRDYEHPSVVMPGNAGSSASSEPFDPSVTAIATTSAAVSKDASTQTAGADAEVAEDAEGPEPRPRPGRDNHTDPHPHPHGHDDDHHGPHPHGDDDDHPHGPHHHDHDDDDHDDRPHHHHHHHGWSWRHDSSEQEGGKLASKEEGRPEFDGDEDDEDDDDDDVMMPHHHLSVEERDALRHCALRVGPWALVLLSLGITAAIYAAYLAALRRRMIRERFGIDGSFKHDLLLWLGCAPCALAQETRTLMFNNVEEGLWHGPLATAPHQVQPMAA